jgi:hypothetical protein
MHGIGVRGCAGNADIRALPAQRRFFLSTDGGIKNKTMLPMELAVDDLCPNS